MRPSVLLNIQDSKSRDDATHENSGRKRNEDSENENSVKNTKGGKMGRWTAEEKQRFIDALKVYGKDWKKVEKFIGTRSGA